MAATITKLIPILHVPDPSSERDFYVTLGLRTTYEGPEYPGFLAVGNEHVEFGLSTRPDADPKRSGFTWQLGVNDLDAAVSACDEAGIQYELSTEAPRDDWTYRVLTLRSPNGFDVILEEQAD